MNSLRLACIGLLVLLAGCYSTGRQFQRPNLDALELRKTTPGAIVAALGKPDSVAWTTRNGKKVERFQYQYFTSQGFATGSGPVGRTASYFFADGVLVAYLYTSNFPGESTDFDVAKAQTIIKGRSTRQEAQALLGKPVGMAVFPMIDSMEDTEMRYSYIGSSAMGSKTVAKTAIFRMGNNGLITHATVIVEEGK